MPWLHLLPALTQVAPLPSAFPFRLNAACRSLAMPWSWLSLCSTLFWYLLSPLQDLAHKLEAFWWSLLLKSLPLEDNCTFLKGKNHVILSLNPPEPSFGVGWALCQSSINIMWIISSKYMCTMMQYQSVLAISFMYFQHKYPYSKTAEDIRLCIDGPYPDLL